MTKLFKLCAVLALSVAMMLAVVACGDKDDNDHVHEFGKMKVTKEATCTEDGTQERKCDECGKVRKFKIDAIGHDFNFDTLSCNNCGESLGEIAICSHVFDEWGYCNICGYNRNDSEGSENPGGISPNEPTPTEKTPIIIQLYENDNYGEFAPTLKRYCAGQDTAGTAEIDTLVRNRNTEAYKHANVNVKMIDQGSSELNIIIGVADEDFETAIKAIYDIFVMTKL